MKNFFLILLFTPLGLWAQTYDVLFLGNSYTGANNLPDMVSEVALSLGDTINYDSSAPGGCTFEVHTNNSTSMAKIASQPWDFVVLQAQSQEPSFPPSQVEANTYPYAAALVDAIAANDTCTEPLFFMTWGRKNGDQKNGQFYDPLLTYEGMQGRLRESYLEMGYTHDATVSPVGMAWRKSIETNPDFELYTGDGSHPNVAGSYLTACTFYSTIFQESCVGASYYPEALTAEDATYLQEIASSTVLDSTAVWNMFAIQQMDYYGFFDLDFTSLASNADGYHWDFGDGSTSSEQNPFYTYQGMDSIFTVTLTAYSNGGCLSVSQQMLVEITNTNAEGLIRDATVSIYPNPVQDHLTIEVAEETMVSLYNTLGDLLYRDQKMDNSVISMNEYPIGLYLLQLESSGANRQFKLIKQ